jgi:hypothetical protein
MLLAKRVSASVVTSISTSVSSASLNFMMRSAMALISEAVKSGSDGALVSARRIRREIDFFAERFIWRRRLRF